MQVQSKRHKIWTKHSIVSNKEEFIITLLEDRSTVAYSYITYAPKHEFQQKSCSKYSHQFLKTPESNSSISSFCPLVLLQTLYIHKENTVSNIFKALLINVILANSNIDL